jgi:putative ABC transport system ATP-binding protein
LPNDLDDIARCADLVRTYRTSTGEVQALRGVSASFTRGAVTAVVGPSGSGKSSLLRLMAGLDRASGGTMQIDGTAITAASSRARRHLRRSTVGYVFQRPSDNFVPHLSVGAHLRLAAGRTSSGSDLAELLDALGIGHRAGNLPGELSGGEQQRAAFGQALATGSPLVVADEPTAELDGPSGAAVLERIRVLADRGTSFVIATHDPAVVAVSDHTLELDHGSVRGTLATANTVRDDLGVDELLWPASIEPVWDDGPVVELVGVSKTYGHGEEAVHALVDVDLEARPGEVIALVGRSGSGKTTLLHSVAGWEVPDRGVVTTPGGREPDWSQIAVVPQRLGLMEELTVQENVEYPARVRGDLEDRRELVASLLHRFGLEELRDRAPRETSLGEQQRTALARVLVLRPQVLIADEPTGHQDAAWVATVFATLQEAAALGTCCIVATHDGTLERFADRTLSVVDGRIVAASQTP